LLIVLIVLIHAITCCLLFLSFYKSLPPITKAYGTICVVANVAFHLGPYRLEHIAFLHKLVISDFQVWRLLTNFFFLGNFSVNFGIRLLMIARYGVQLEKGPFERWTADFLWMMIVGALSLLALSAIPMLRSPFLGISLVFMLLYIWSREFPNAQVNVYGLVALKAHISYKSVSRLCLNSAIFFHLLLLVVWVCWCKCLYVTAGTQAFYLPWAMLALDVLFGSPLKPDLMGIIAGHIYYFLTVLQPLAGGRNILATPTWVYPFMFYSQCINLLKVEDLGTLQMPMSNKIGQPAWHLEGGVRIHPLVKAFLSGDSGHLEESNYWKLQML
ncbi:Derlin - like 3, partial [Theobroma cacao]